MIIIQHLKRKHFPSNVDIDISDFSFRILLLLFFLSHAEKTNEEKMWESELVLNGRDLPKRLPISEADK